LLFTAQSSKETEITNINFLYDSLFHFLLINKNYFQLVCLFHIILVFLLNMLVLAIYIYEERNQWNDVPKNFRGTPVNSFKLHSILLPLGKKKLPQLALLIPLHHRTEFKHCYIKAHHQKQHKGSWIQFSLPKLAYWRTISNTYPQPCLALHVFTLYNTSNHNSLPDERILTPRQLMSYIWSTHSWCF